MIADSVSNENTARTTYCKTDIRGENIRRFRVLNTMKRTINTTKSTNEGAKTPMNDAQSVIAVAGTREL